MLETASCKELLMNHDQPAIMQMGFQSADNVPSSELEIFFCVRVLALQNVICGTLRYLFRLIKIRDNSVC